MIKDTSAQNIEIIRRIIEGKEIDYPHLQSFLRKYNKGWRLIRFLQRIATLDTSTPGNIIEKDRAGFEWVKAPVRELSAMYGGSLTTWKENINKFCGLGLLYVRKPANHSPQNNTSAQNYSITVAANHGGHSKPASYYSVPPYTPQQLAEANRRAEALSNHSGGWAKDVYTDVLGQHTANTATDTAYPMHKDTIAQREALKAALLRLIAERGYAYPEEPLNEALAQNEEVQFARQLDVFDESAEAAEARANARKAERRYSRTWNGYMHSLFKAEGLKKSTPTKHEMELFGLQGKRHIIRHNGSEGA